MPARKQSPKSTYKRVGGWINPRTQELANFRIAMRVKPSIVRRIDSQVHWRGKRSDWLNNVLEAALEGVEDPYPDCHIGGMYDAENVDTLCGLRLSGAAIGHYFMDEARRWEHPPGNVCPKCLEALKGRSKGDLDG